MTAAQFVRVAGRQGRAVSLQLDGKAIEAMQGESVLAALLLQGAVLRHGEFGGEPRAGFCLMGACQDCWIWTQTGERLRACTTQVAAGMALSTRAPALFAHE